MKLSSLPLKTDPRHTRTPFVIADYNREKDRTTVEQTFAALIALAESLMPSSRERSRKDLRRKRLAIFDLIKRDKLSQKDREKVKQASQSLWRASASC
ncbi:MAG: hypothetical protein R3C05_11505 [Pirellulaceae bacterium]